MRTNLLVLVMTQLAMVAIFACPQPAAAQKRTTLLNVSSGQRPNDTGLDGQSKMTIENNTPLGGKALKVVFASGDSIGNAGVGERNWKQFEALEFSAFNPTAGDINLTFSARHAGTTSFQTRVDVPVVLKPGKNAVRLKLDEMANVNGSAPDLSGVNHWYLSVEEGQTPTLFFGDVVLVPAGDATAPKSFGVIPVPAGGGSYRIRGKIGDQDVDLIVTPLDAPDQSSTSKVSEGPRDTSDPARLARIRAAKMPPVTRPTAFYTPEADAILSALEVFPPDNAFNQVITDWPLHPNSKNIVASIGAGDPLRYNPDMGFVIVPPTQRKIAVKLGENAEESDEGPYPVPEIMPIEGWPAHYQREESLRGFTLQDVQRDKAEEDGDRHAIVLDPTNRVLYEFYQARLTDGGWTASQASIFDLKTNELRPDGWTSADAAGLPIFPAVVRYDEIKRGAIEHAMRVTVERTRRAYVHPATHFASRLEDENLPRMGERLRLRADFDTSGFSPPVRTILKGLQKYGMLVADNGIDWAISVTPDPRIPVLHEELRKVKGSDFEVVVAPE